MHTAGRTQDVAYVVAPATATEHGQPGGNIVVCGLAALPGHRVVSIGSVNVRYDASNDTATRVIELVQHEMHLRLHSCISTREIRDCSCSATEQTDTSAYRSQTIGIAADYYKKRRESSTIEAISRCVSAYQRAADHLCRCDESAVVLVQKQLKDIRNKAKRHVQALLQKCVPNAYLRLHVMDVITIYIGNRSCNAALNILMDSSAFWTSNYELSPQDLKYVLDLLEACAGCVRTSGDEIVAELNHYCLTRTSP